VGATGPTGSTGNTGAQGSTGANEDYWGGYNEFGGATTVNVGTALSFSSGTTSGGAIITTASDTFRFTRTGVYRVVCVAMPDPTTVLGSGLQVFTGISSITTPVLPQCVQWYTNTIVLQSIVSVTTVGTNMQIKVVLQPFTFAQGYSTVFISKLS
jgi:hypothetical protein